MPSHKINIAAQSKNYEELAIQVNKALNNCEKELLESPDIYMGRTPSYWAVQKGSPECLGIMAKAGANLHKACPHVWEVEDPTGYSDGCIVDPSSVDEKLSVYHALNQTTLSFVTRTCCECSSNHYSLKSCSRCKLARYCSEDCQKKNWELHQIVCKRIQKGADLVSLHKRMPEPSKTYPGGFLPFDDIDDNLDPEKQEINASWEYYDIATKLWVAYPKHINWAIETVRSKGTFPRYVYRPGCPAAEGVEETPVTRDPPNDVAMHSICFGHMVEHQIYTGAGRKIRRRELETVRDKPNPEAKPEHKASFFCTPLCGPSN